MGHFDMEKERIPDRRSRVLTDSDIAAIADEVSRQAHIQCRFTKISSEDLAAAVTFYKNFNDIMEDSKKTIWKSVIVLGVGGVFTLVLLGILTKLKTLSNGMDM
jgi:hypothetical protein